MPPCARAKTRASRTDHQTLDLPGRRRHPLHRARTTGPGCRRQARHHRLGALLRRRAGAAVNTSFAEELAAAVGAAQLVAGIDTKGGRIAVKGWKSQVALTPDEAIPQLDPHVAAFLYTHVDGEGLMQGFPIESLHASANSPTPTHRGRRHPQPAGDGCPRQPRHRRRGRHGRLHRDVDPLAKRPFLHCDLDSRHFNPPSAMLELDS